MDEIVHSKKIYYDKRYNFFEIFNAENGTLIRSNVAQTQEEPFKRSYPELIDIGIMGMCEAGHNGICKKAGIDCYQNGPSIINKNMSLDDYEWIITQCKDKVFQVALGGAGDPNKHEYFKEVLELTRRCDIVPNLTTSGYNITDEEVDLMYSYCGAVAVSYYSRIVNGTESNPDTVAAINRLVNKGCITNIHFVISDESTDEAIFRLENDYWPYGINAIIFLLYKPVGMGREDKILRQGNKLSKFLDLAVNKKHRFKVGFDTCFSTALLKMPSVSRNTIDACEAARFSMYIHSDLVATPCSFDNLRRRYSYKLKPNTIKDAWNSNVFLSFLREKDCCKECLDYKDCYGGCHLDLGIDLCDKFQL